jgi:hypothetical protein
VAFRLNTVLVLTVSAALLAACGGGGDKAKDAAGADGAAAEAPKGPPPLRMAFQGNFKPADGTATDFAGSKLELSPINFAGEFINYDLMMAGQPVKGSDLIAAGGKTFAEVLGVPAEATVELRRVMKETYTDWRDNKSFCGAEPTKFLALAKSDGDAGDALKIAAFGGDDVPGATAANSKLCKTFAYTRVPDATEAAAPAAESPAAEAPAAEAPAK